MTTFIKITTNGNYVAELKNKAGDVLGSAGPGSNVESPSIFIPHGEDVTISEREATEDEQHAAANGDEGNSGEHDDQEDAGDEAEGSDAG